MAYEVFISHSSKDKLVADATCASLESHGIRCWIAPRDIRPGDEWGSAIGNAIRTTRVMVLIFSRHANESPQIRREVDRAVNAGATIIPVRIEDVLPQNTLDYCLGALHWLDAFPPPLELHLDRLAVVIHEILSLPGPGQTGPEEEVVQKKPVSPPSARNHPYESSPPKSRAEPEKFTFAASGLFIGLSVGAVVLILCGLAYFIWGRPAPASNSTTSTVVTNAAPATASVPAVTTAEKTVPAATTPIAQPEVPPPPPPPPANQTAAPAAISSVDPAVVGVWSLKINAPQSPPGVMSETYNADGTYKSELVITDSGTYRFGGGHWSMTSNATGKVQEGPYSVSNPQTLLLGPFPWTTAGAPLDPNNPNFVGTWTGTLSLANSTPWQLTLTVNADGTYSMQSDTVDGGTFTAANGNMSCKVNSNGTTVPMSYQSLGPDSMVFTSPLGPATWSRKQP